MNSTPESSARVSRILAVAIIPARLASTRLERKMLLAESGLPLVVHTADNVARARSIARVVVATDSEEIARAVRAGGFESAATSTDHKSGTDRVHEAYRALGTGADVVVNVQGDEPELLVSDLDRLVATFEDPAVEVATLAGAIESEAEARSSAVVKVVCDARNDALYFSRAAIPSRAHARGSAPPFPAVLRRHVGVYAFRPRALERFCALPEGRLEALENLEQLRWLEAGGRMRVVDASRVPLGIDTREDYDAFVKRMKAAK